MSCGTLTCYKCGNCVCYKCYGGEEEEVEMWICGACLMTKGISLGLDEYEDEEE